MSAVKARKRRTPRSRDPKRMTQSDDKSIMRSLGEFFGHIVRGVKTDPGQASSERIKEVGRHVEEQHRDGVVLRRTTIEEIEIREQDKGHEPGGRQ